MSARLSPVNILVPSASLVLFLCAVLSPANLVAQDESTPKYQLVSYTKFNDGSQIKN
jgi:hypothetical protein